MNAYNDIIKDIDIGYIPEAHEVIIKLIKLGRLIHDKLL
jgi:hypothetical protein